jgi:hypothetical protein
VPKGTVKRYFIINFVKVLLCEDPREGPEALSITPVKAHNLKLDEKIHNSYIYKFVVSICD